MDTTFYLKEPKSTQPTAIMISMYCDDDRLRRSTGVFIHPDYWEDGWFKKKARNKELADLASDIKDITNRIEEHLKLCRFNDEPVLTMNIIPLIKKKAIIKQNFIALYDKVIEGIKKGDIKKQKNQEEYSKGTVGIFATNKNLLKDFNEATGISLDPGKVNDQTVKSFVNWMNRRDHSSLNYVATQVGVWRMTMDILRELGYHKNIFITDKKVIPAPERVSKIKVSEEEVEKILNLDLLANPHRQACRDRWVLQYATGLRVSDGRRLSLNHFGEEAITLINQKTGKKVVIPYHWMALEILKRYKGQLPPKKWTHEINIEIKEIAKEAGFTKKFTYKITRRGVQMEETKFQWQLFTNHTTRRAIVTHLIKNGISHDVGGDMVGMCAATWGRYNVLTPEDKAEVLKNTGVFERKVTQK